MSMKCNSMVNFQCGESERGGEGRGGEGREGRLLCKLRLSFLKVEWMLEDVSHLTHTVLLFLFILWNYIIKDVGEMMSSFAAAVS